MKKYSRKERFRYWFDNQMAKGTTSMVGMLAICSFVVILIVSIIISLFHLQEDGTYFTAFWDSFATVINAWMPYSGDGGIAYILLTAVVAIIGVLFTSVLIGIVGTVIEEKITSLRKGNSRILEEGHIIVLGFRDGEYELLSQLVHAAADEERVIVVAEEMEREEMESAISDNIEIPKNVKIICRNVDICDSVALSCCSIPDAQSVIVSPFDDGRTVKIILAVSAILEKKKIRTVKIISTVRSDNYLLPQSILDRRNIIMLQTNDVIAKIIARSCTQPGISDTFLEMLDFAGSEIYVVPPEQAVGLPFGDIVCSTNHSVPIGIIRDGNTILVPDSDTAILATDRIVCFAESRTAAHIHLHHLIWEQPAQKPERVADYNCEQVAIIGYNEVFGTIIRELPSDEITITLAGITEEQAKEAKHLVSTRENIRLRIFDGDVRSPQALEDLILPAEHVVLLNSHSENEDESDIQNMLLLLKIRDIRIRYQKEFTITTELQRENNRRLIASDSQIDFVVASNMSSMVLAQISESPELCSVYSELLADRGNDLCLKEVSRFGYTGGEITIAELRKLALMRGYVAIGYLRYSTEDYHVVLNPDYHKKIILEPDDSLILIGLS